MRKFLTAVILLAVIADGFGLWYLIRRQDAAEAGLKESISKEIEERYSIEQGIKDEFESKRQARDFLARREYEKQLEDFALKLDEFKAQLEEAEQSLKGQINSLSDNSAKLDGYARSLEANFGSSVKELEARMKDNAKELEAKLGDKLAEQKEGLALLEKNLAASLKELENTDRLAKEYIRKLKASLEERLSALEQPKTSTPDGL